MRNYRPSSELQRAAEQNLRNQRRLAIWRKRYWQQLEAARSGAPALRGNPSRAEDGAGELN